MIDRICLLVNYNLYETKRNFTKKFAQAMHRKGIDTLIIDVQEKALERETIEEIVIFSPQLTCSFNSFLPDNNGNFLWDLLRIPHLSILLDPAFYSINLTKSPYSIISCVDLFDCEALRSFGFKHEFFFPHAIENLKDEHEKMDSGHRPYDIVFIGSCHDYEYGRQQWQKTLSPTLCKVLDDAIDLVLSDNAMTLALALVTACNASDLENQTVDFAQLFNLLDFYTRGKDRVELIKSITRGHVHVFGELCTDTFPGKNGWDHYLADQKHVTIHPTVSYEKSLEILKNSKICLNSMPFFKNGTHERVFNGLTQGAYVLSSSSFYLQTEFAEDEGISYYNHSRWDEANAIIEKILSNQKLRDSAVMKGRKKVLQKHTWDNRVDLLLKEVPHIFEKE